MIEIERSVTSRYYGWITTIVSESNDDGDGNKNGKKAIGFY